MDNFNLKKYLAENILLNESTIVHKTVTEDVKELSLDLSQLGGILNLSNTPIISLPDNLQVGGSLYLTNTPLSKKHTEKEIRQIADIKGKIYI